MGSEPSDDDVVFKFGRENLPFNSPAKKAIREYYDRFYGRTEFEYYGDKVARRFLRAILRKARVPSHAAILDVGCATGFYTEQFRNMGYHAVGLDISCVGILKGHSKYPFVSFLVGDATALPFKQSSFDAIFMLGCSLTNTYDLQAIRGFLSYLTDYVVIDGVVIVIGGSDFTGGLSSHSEWICHRYDEILDFVDRKEEDVDGPYITFVKPMAVFGRLSLNRVFSFVIRIVPGKRLRRVIYFVRKKRR